MIVSQDDKQFSLYINIHICIGIAAIMHKPTVRTQHGTVIEVSPKKKQGVTSFLNILNLSLGTLMEVSVKTVRKSPETKQSQRPKQARCNKLAGSSSSPNTLRATLGEHTNVEKCKGQTLGKRSQTNLSSRQPWPSLAQALNTKGSEVRIYA